MIDNNVIQATCVLTNVANCKNECKGKCEHQKVSKSTVSKYVGGAEKAYNYKLWSTCLAIKCVKPTTKTPS